MPLHLCLFALRYCAVCLSALACLLRTYVHGCAVPAFEPLTVAPASTSKSLDRPALDLAAIAGGDCSMFSIIARDCFITASSNCHFFVQCDRVSQRVQLTCRRYPWPALRAPSALVPRNLADIVVVLAAVLGSRTAEMSATQTLIIHGSRASKLAHVSSADTGFHK